MAKKVYKLYATGTPVFTKLLVEEEYKTNDFSLTLRSGFPYYGKRTAVVLMGDKTNICYQHLFDTKDIAMLHFNSIKSFIHNM